MNIKFLLLILLIFIVSGCSLGNHWQGIYYPNGCLVCEDDYIFSPIFNNYDDCQKWVINLYNKRNNELDQYECGKNCKNKNGILVCAETK